MLRFSLLFLFGSSVAHCFGQSPTPDSSFVQLARDEAIAAYNQAIRLQAHVYDGHEYIAHDHRIKVHPFYRVDSLLTGTVISNGVRYDNVRMLYDLVRDELAVQQPEGGFRLRLGKNQVSAFTMGPYRFTRIEGDSAVGVPTGFYEVLHDGRVKALAHRAKTINEDISQGFYKAEYQPKDRFFVVKEGAYYEIKSKQSLLKLFPEQSKALRKYLRANELRFIPGQRETSLVRVMQQIERSTL